jgi:hypothetical protein
VVAPGFKVMSALAGGQSGGDKFCGVYETFGTSMATPVVAGGALVLRDYFQNLWSSVCRPSYAYCKAFAPSGYLLKALFVHSGQAVASYSESAFDARTDVASHSLGSPPDSVQGYGSVNLHAVLPLTASERDQHDLYVLDGFSMGGRTTATLAVKVASSKRPLKVTLLWYDRASAVGNSADLLVLNLDLVVTSPSGARLHGNGDSAGDAVNPQEQVYVARPEKGVYTVSVTNVGYFSVTSALVVTCDGSVSAELSLGDSATLDLDTAALDLDTAALDLNTATATSGVTSLASTVTASAAAAVATAATTVATVASSVPLFSNFDLVKSFTLHHTLTANQKVLLKTFELPDESLLLFSLELSLDAHYCSGSEAFIFAVMVVAPNGEVVQMGGYNEYYTLDRLWQRMSPVQWTAASAPPDGGSYWRSTRYTVDLQLAQRGLYSVYIELMHDSWPTTTYNGNVKLNFVDEATAMQRSKSSGGFFSALGAAGAGLLIFALAAAVVFAASLVLRKRRGLRARDGGRGEDGRALASPGGGVKRRPKSKAKAKKPSKQLGLAADDNDDDVEV